MRDILTEKDQELKIWEAWLDQGLITQSHFNRVMNEMKTEIKREIDRLNTQRWMEKMFIDGLNAAETVMAYRSIGQGGSYVL